jgi:uncharacterized protein (UPF0335 family)
MKDEARMRETEEDRAVRDQLFAGTAAELAQFVERIEALEAEKKALAEDQKEVMAEAKGRGYATWAIKDVVKLRRMKADVLAEKEAVLDLYRRAVGV